MEKSREYNFLRVILTLFVCLLPILGSATDERAVIYTSFCVLAVAMGYVIYRFGEIAFSKTTVFLLIVAAYSYLQLFFVSDKASQTAFASLWLAGALASVLICNLKCLAGYEIDDCMTHVFYTAAMCYAAAAIFSQIFVESEFFGCNMDMGNNSKSAAAFLMLVGMAALLKMFSGKKKTPVFFAAFIIMGYVFAMTKSQCAFLCAAVMVFIYTMRMKQSRVRAFFALVAAVIFAFANAVAMIYAFATGNVAFDASVKAISKMIGLGKGGYEAYAAVFDGGYKSVRIIVDVFCEAYGILGVVLITVLVVKFLMKYNSTRSVRDMFFLIALCMLIFTSAEAMVFLIPLAAIYTAADEECEFLKIPKGAAFFLGVPICFFVLLTAGRTVGFFGKDALESEEYSVAADYCTVAANMQMFDSKAWENAYAALKKDYEENSADNLNLQEKCLENAEKYNKANYKYKRLKADVYTEGEKYSEALAVWEKIIAKNDREVLYPEYAQKICDVMQYETLSFEEMRALYKKMVECADKCTNLELRTEVWDVLTRAQKYYVKACEGEDQSADMYGFEPYVNYEEASEALGD